MRKNKILLELYNDKKQIMFLSVLMIACEWLNSFIPNNPYIIEATGAVIGAVAAVGTLAYTAYSGSQNRAAAASAALDASLEKQKEQEELEKQKEILKSMRFKNPYQENVYEDLTINQQQAQFEAQQGAQQRANIMDTMRGAAGGSGIAGLAQMLANQGQLSTQRAAASIGQQEAANRRLMAQGALQRQQGEANIQQQEYNRQMALLNLEQGQASAAVSAASQARQNELNVQQQSSSDLMSAGMGVAQSFANLGQTMSANKANRLAEEKLNFEKNQLIRNKLGEQSSSIGSNFNFDEDGFPEYKGFDYELNPFK